MALTEIQKDVMVSIAKNRSDTSYVAGGVVLNMDWPRMSDDIFGHNRRLFICPWITI